MLQPNRTNRQCGDKNEGTAYLRLSKDDGIGESASISTQRKIIHNYAKEHGFKIVKEYVDDGWSGTNFERPGFQQMIKDIEDKKVHLIITKDLSRLGRDYIQTGQYTEIFFPTKGVRYIAINDGYDSDSPYSDIAPFKNVVNEMYARDISRKIRSSFIANMEDGNYIGNFAPYGYQKDPADKHRLIPDEAAAATVKMIFEMAAGGTAPTGIADFLNANSIPPPAIYRCIIHPHLNPDNYSRRKEWTASNVVKLLRNTVYLGHLSQGKTSKVSFKSAVTVQKPRQDWIVVENTHEPLVSQELYDEVRRRSQSRTCNKNGGFQNIFSGIAKCADCGRNMSAVGTRKKGSPANLACGGYKLYGSEECSNHFIDYNTLYDIVLDSIRERVRLSKKEQDEILKCLQEELSAKINDPDRKRKLANLKAKGQELDKTIERLYEDHVQGVLSGDRFTKLLDKYENESKDIAAKIQILDMDADLKQQSAKLQESHKKLRARLMSFTNVKELSIDTLFQLIDRIEIEQGYFEKTEHGRVKHQTVKIYFRFTAETTTKRYCI